MTAEKAVVKSDLNVLLNQLLHKIILKHLISSQNAYRIMEILKERMKENDPTFFKKGIEQQKEWLEVKKKNYEIVIKSVQKKLLKPDIEDWIFSYKPRGNSGSSKPNQIYNSEIKLLTEIYKNKAHEFSSSDLQSFNLQKFNFYVEIIKEKKTKKLGFNLLEALIKYVSSDKFFWDRTYSDLIGRL